MQSSPKPGPEPRFEPRGPKHEPKKFQGTWFIKKKIMLDKTIALYYHKYLSQEGNNMNQKSWKLQYDILTFSKKNNKKEEDFRSPNFG